jgi:CheY-like chemotaxis protein
MASLKDMNVLVVDDDVVILRLVREALTSLIGCAVDTTPNPEYAFELMLKKDYDLLILDFLMPGIDGATLYALITKVHATKSAYSKRRPRVLIMSGNAAHKRAQELLREPGVRGLVAKPFSIDRLVEKVSEALSD